MERVLPALFTQVYTPEERTDVMSVQLAPNHVLELIAQEYSIGGRYADRQLPQCSKVAAIVAADPASALNKKITLVVKNGGVSATKMLRLYKVATTSGLEASDLKKLLKNEAKRLVNRALDLSARHGAKARVRVSTLRALFVAGFIKESTLKEIQTNMLIQKQVRELIVTYNGVDAIRWEQLKKAYSGLFQESTPVVARKSKAKTRKPTISKASRREAGVVVQKPLTKAAFLLLKDSFGNLLPASAKKQAIKAERTAKAQQRRRVNKANGGAKVGGPGEGVTVRKPLLKWCAAGHVGVKACK